MHAESGTAAHATASLAAHLPADALKVQPDMLEHLVALERKSTTVQLLVVTHAVKFSRWLRTVDPPPARQNGTATADCQVERVSHTARPLAVRSSFEQCPVVVGLPGLKYVPSTPNSPVFGTPSQIFGVIFKLPSIYPS